MNHSEGIPPSKNIKCITHHMNTHEMAGLYNICDYVISFTRGEGVGLPMLEAKYFGKPVISHVGGVLETIRGGDDSWIVLPAKEIPIDLTNVPTYLHKVFYGTWWDVDMDAAVQVLKICFVNR
jgi:glycosyltransferase involved in cell wall biosynthesis